MVHAATEKEVFVFIFFDKLKIYGMFQHTVNTFFLKHIGT
jgi:hypothetical protein